MTRLPRPYLLAALLACTIPTGHVLAQTGQARTERMGELAGRDAAERDSATRLARERGWPEKGETKDGAEFELVRIPKIGAPLYNMTTSTRATISVNAVVVHTGPPVQTGEGVRLGIWDSSGARRTHQEFALPGGESRVQRMDGTASASHPTSVTGVALSAGVNPDALGIAPSATASNYNWTSDYAEMVSEAATLSSDLEQIQISNHSYGFSTGWVNGSFSGTTGWHWWGNWKAGEREDRRFGWYGDDTREIDQIAWDNPYFLPVWAAGNDRNKVYGGPRDGTGIFFWFDNDLNQWVQEPYIEATAPFDDNFKEGGFNTVLSRASAKNHLSVGAISPAVFEGERDPSVSVPLSFSAWGPTDDGRIKPDLVGNGAGMLLVLASADDAYSSGAQAGTSYAAPNVSGAAALVVAAAREGTHPWMMRASTLKALLIHGASDLGRPGPDYENGWGLPDVAASIVPVRSLTDASLAATHPLLEAYLDNASGLSHSYSVEWSGGDPLRVTLCWTDPPGTVVNALNDPAPKLVHDLDLRVTGPTGTHFPFVLDPANPSQVATTGDNVVDTVEQVLIPSGGPAGTYTITVSAKGPLALGGQWYSLVVSGPDPAPAPAPLDLVQVNHTINNPEQMVELVLTGAVFHPGTRVELVNNVDGTVQAFNLRVAPDSIMADVELDSVNFKEWDVVVSRPDGESATLVNGLVLQATRVDTWILMER